MADSSWLMADAWECSQSGWTRTALVLNELGKRLPQIDGRTIKVMMVSPAHASQPHAARPLARSPARSAINLTWQHTAPRTCRYVAAICCSRSR